MAIQNVSGNQQVPEYKSPDEINLKPAEVYDTQKIGNVLAGIENGVDRDIQNALANDNAIDDTENGLLQRWLNKANELSKSISNIMSDTYNGYQARFKAVIQNLEKYIKPANNNYEPNDVDSVNNTSEKFEYTAETLRIPDRKFQALSENKKECERIKKEYDKCFDGPHQSNRKIASDLKCFQAKYESQLKTVASSINIGRKDANETLFDQVEREIRYYDNLADQEAQNTNQPHQKPGLSVEDRAKLANQKKHTKEDFINDLILRGYTKEQAEKIANDNGIV